MRFMSFIGVSMNTEIAQPNSDEFTKNGKSLINDSFYGYHTKSKRWIRI